MNYPSRSDDLNAHPDWNQNPQDLNADATTRADLNGMVNRRQSRNVRSNLHSGEDPDLIAAHVEDDEDGIRQAKGGADMCMARIPTDTYVSAPEHRPFIFRARDALVKYAQFVGPGVSDDILQRVSSSSDIPSSSLPLLISTRATMLQTSRLEHRPSTGTFSLFSCPISLPSFCSHSASS